MLTRRAFVGVGLATAAAGTLGSTGAAPAAEAAAPAGAGKPPAPAPAAYGRAMVIDSLVAGGPFFAAAEAVAAGLTALVVDLDAYPRNFTQAVEALVDWSSAFHEKDTPFLRVREGADLDRAKAQGKLGIVLACQDASILDAPTGSVDDRNLRKLRFLHDLGLRVLQLTHNERNGVGDTFREKSDAGLSRLGERVVAEMNALGMLVDLSHCSDRTTLETIALATRPVAVTHAGCRALYPTLRNKGDDVLRALAAKGGYFGVYNMTLWLTDKDQAGLDDVLDHIDHAVKIGGIDLAGFGSDGTPLANRTSPAARLQGMQAYAQRNLGLPAAEKIPRHVLAEELNSPHRLEILATGLARRGYADDAIEKVLGGNFARVFRAACG
jgi:membrane dipeptidase